MKHKFDSVCADSKESSESERGWSHCGCCSFGECHEKETKQKSSSYSGEASEEETDGG